MIENNSSEWINDEWCDLRLDKYAAFFLSTLEMIPQSRHDLAHDNLIWILADKSQHKHAILSQVLLPERFEHFLVEFLATKSIHEFEVFFEKTDAIPLERVPEPEKETVDGGERHIDEPEPNNYEDFLVE